jgi:hypothetical protein
MARAVSTAFVAGAALLATTVSAQPSPNQPLSLQFVSSICGGRNAASA